MIHYLYRLPAAKAREYDRLNDYYDSMIENQKCCKDMAAFSEESYSPDRLKALSEKYGLDRIRWVIAANILSGGNNPQDRISWVKRVIPDNFPLIETYGYNSGIADNMLDRLINDLNGLYSSLGLLGEEHCSCTDKNADYKEKLVIINPDILREEYKKPENQYVFVIDGRGCSQPCVLDNPFSSDMFGVDLTDRTHTRLNRKDIIGIADREQLPEWAKKQFERFESVEPSLLLNDDVDFGNLSEIFGPTMK